MSDRHASYSPSNVNATTTPRSHLFVIPSEPQMNDPQATSLSLAKTRDHRFIRTPRASYFPERSTTPSRSVWNAQRPSWGGGIMTPDVAIRSQSTGRSVQESDGTHHDPWQFDKQFLMSMMKEMQADRALLLARLDNQLAANESAQNQIREHQQQQDQLKSILDDKEAEVELLKRCETDPYRSVAHQQLENRIRDLMETIRVLSERLKTMAVVNHSLRQQIANQSADRTEKQLLLRRRWTAAITIQKHWRRWAQQQRYNDLLYDRMVLNQTADTPSAKQNWASKTRREILSTVVLAVAIIGMLWGSRPDP